MHTNPTVCTTRTLRRHLDLVAAYNDAAGRTPVMSVPVELGGGPPLLAGIWQVSTSPPSRPEPSS